MNKILRFTFAFLILLIAATAFGQDKVNSELADKLLAFQNDNGGWPKNYEWDEPLDSKRNKEFFEKGYGSTIDNGATHREIRYLCSAYFKLKDKRYRTAALKGTRYLLKAQYDNGGWPQYYPYKKSDYNRYITFNDGAMIGTMQLLDDIAKGKSQYSFFDDDIKKQAANAVKKGIDCILKCQVVVNGKKTVWCAQHDEKNFAPSKARSYELASLSGAESVGIVNFLMKIESPKPEIIKAVDSAVQWFDQAKIEGIKVKIIRDKSFPQGRDKIVVQEPSASPVWARFYEIETNKPIFCSRDGIIKRNLSEISHERRNGYSWYVGSANDLLEKDYPQWKKQLKKT